MEDKTKRKVAISLYMKRRQIKTDTYSVRTMDSSALVERVQELTDIELAILLSLASDQHCNVVTERDNMEPLLQELELVLRMTPVLRSFPWLRD